MSASSRIVKIRGNLDRDAFGAKIGVSGRTVQRWELNDELPKGKEVVKITEIFGVNAHWLLTGQGEPYIKASGKSSMLVEESAGSFGGRIRGAEEPEGDDQANLARTIEMLMRIVGSGNKTLNRAIFSGLEAFTESVSQKNHLAALEAKVHDLTEIVQRVQQENKALRTELNRMKAIYENPGAAPDDEEEQAV
ncbi:MAG: helix-turn-helix domain-containing protein [Candidatus Omnitrophica bacterium]|nr:helix-turn-helix domain-containing protein [Candidatus Omnitrophota bacterium]